MNEKDYNVKHKNEIDIDILPLMKALLSKVWLMVLIGIVVAGIAFGTAKMLIKPSFRCGFNAYVNNQHAQSVDKNSLTNQDLVAAQHLTKTLSYIIRSNTILSASLKSIDSDLTYEEFSKMVLTEIKDETELISVYVVNQDPQKAYDLANAIAKTAPSYMADIVEGSSMKIVDYPVYSDKKYKPNYQLYALMGFVAGFLVVMIIMIIRYFRDDSVKNENDIEMRFSIPVLGVIPDIEYSGQKSGNYYSSQYEYSYDKRKEEKGEEA